MATLLRCCLYSARRSKRPLVVLSLGMKAVPDLGELFDMMKSMLLKSFFWGVFLCRTRDRGILNARYAFSDPFFDQLPCFLARLSTRAHHRSSSCRKERKLGSPSLDLCALEIRPLRDRSPSLPRVSRLPGGIIWMARQGQLWPGAREGGWAPGRPGWLAPGRCQTSSHGS